MTKHRRNEPHEREHREGPDTAAPQQSIELDRYDDDDAATLPWLPLADRKGATLH